MTQAHPDIAGLVAELRDWAAAEKSTGLAYDKTVAVMLRAADALAALSPVPGEGVTDEQVERAFRSWNPSMLEALDSAPADGTLRRLVDDTRNRLRAALTAANLPHKGDEWRDARNAALEEAAKISDVAAGRKLLPFKSVSDAMLGNAVLDGWRSCATTTAQLIRRLKSPTLEEAAGEGGMK